MRIERPNPIHLLSFAVLLLSGTASVGGYEWYHGFEFVRVLSNLSSVLVISSGWAVAIGEGTMFVESIMEERRQRLLQEGRQEGQREGRQKVLEQLRQKIRTTGKITEEDLQQFET